jgi:hypothetical protein
MKLTQDQHQEQKYNKFKDVQIDESNIEKYIHITNNNNNKNNYQYIKININGVKTTFVGKHETINETKNRAMDFIKNLINGNMIKLRETTLEPSLPPLFGNIPGELV